MVKKAKEELIPVDPKLLKSLETLEMLKSEVDSVGNACLQIKVMDEATLPIAHQNLSKISNIVGVIEAKRIEIKAPYLEAGKLVDSTAKRLTDVANQAVIHLKSEIRNWELTRQEKERKAQVELEAKLHEQQAAVEQAEAKRKEINDYIQNKAIPVLKKYYDSASSIEKCDKYISDIEKGYKPREFFGDLAQEAYRIKDQYVELIKVKREQLVKGDQMSDEQKALAAQKEALEFQKIEIARKEAELKAMEEAARQEKERKEEEERLRKEAELAASLDKTRNTRTIWKFELMDYKQLPQEWVSLNEQSVRQWMKDNKEELKEGVINGVKFFKDVTVIA